MNWWRIARMVLGGVVILSVWFAAATTVAGRSIAAAPAWLADFGDSGVTSAQAESSVAVRVQSESCGGSVSGSGFVVEGQLFTNRHVVGDAEVVAVSTAGSPWISVDIPVLGRSSRIDAAVAGPVPRALDIDPVVLARSDAQVGDSVRLIGWVDGRVRQRDATVHLFTDGAAYGVDGQVMLIEPATTFGFSGGPVLNGDGDVVAMLQSVDLTTSLTLAIPVSELRDPAVANIYGAGPPNC